MSKVTTTRMSSRGQVVIPEEVRRRLRLTKGSEFVVLGEGDVVVLKVIKTPSMRDFDWLIAEAENAAARAGMTVADVEVAVGEVRKSK